MSVAGGLHRAIERVRSVDGTALQIFTRNQRRWRAAPIAAEEAALWKRAMDDWGPYPVAAHASYLINPANPDPDKAARSVAALADELERCAALGIPFLVLHPGAHLGAGEGAGLAACAENLDRALETAGAAAQGVTLLLETTAGQGTNLGADFAHFTTLLERSRRSARLGVCLDTCHVFAAGHDLRTPEALDATLAALDRAVGLERLRFVHLNDSKTPLGSRTDRHEHIGRGAIRTSGFAALMNDPRITALPLVLETDKGDDLADDARNMAVLRGLVHEKKKMVF